MCVFEDGSIKADLIRNTLTIDEEVHIFHVQRNETYLAMHKAVFEDKSECLCSFEQGYAVLELIQCIEESARTGFQATNANNELTIYH